ncbi:hypothetical protein, partial [Haloferula sp. BvORR071]|uniref:hypothetical protein n=1 Tax=Haloferula sp. BvORR071 TaxID=1396141 RepID=UPI0022410512
MSCSFWRCPAALVAIWCISASAAEAQAACGASFPGTAGEVSSVAFGVGDGRHYVAVALPEAQAEGGKLRAQGRVLPSEL